MSVRLLLILVFVPLGFSRLQAVETKTIVFLGDSITAGYGLENPSAQAYPALIQQKITATSMPYRVVNAGISGDTTSGGLRRLDWIFRQRVDILVIALGGNDGLRGIDPGVTHANLQALIDRVRAKRPGIRLMLAGMQMPSNMSEAFTRQFAEIFPDLAQKNDLVLVPFLLEGVGGVPELNQPDFIHPTAHGQTLIADNVWRHLHPML